MMFRRSFPKVPGTRSLVKAQVLKKVPATHGLPLGLPTTSGREQLNPTVPPQSVFELFTKGSVTVNQFPVEAETIPATCQFPITWFKNPEAFPAKALPLPNGRSQA